MNISKAILSLSLLLSFSKTFPMMIASRAALTKQSPVSSCVSSRVNSDKTMRGDGPLPLIIPKLTEDIKFESFGRKMREWEYPNTDSELIRNGDLKSLSARWDELSEDEKTNFRAYVTTAIPEMNYGLHYIKSYAHDIIKHIKKIENDHNQDTRHIMSISEKELLAIPHAHAQHMKLLTNQLGKLVFCAHAYDRIVSQTFINAHNKELEGLATK